MKKNLITLFILLFSLSIPAFAAAPPINFATATFTPGGNWPSFNSGLVDDTSFAGIGISGFTYSSGIYRQDQGYLWLRKNTNDNGLGYCSTVDTCGATNTTGDGDYNELDNAGKNEVIRLARPDDKVWSDIWVSSLDDGGTNGNETGTFYWSNSLTPTLTGGIVFSHDSMFGNNTSTAEGSIFTYLVNNGFDVTAKYVFFRAGSYDANGIALNGTDNDYLVYGVDVTAPVPEPEIYAMMAAGLALMGWVGRRRKQHTV